MNRSRCNTCKSFVPVERVERDEKVYLVKTCPDCGVTETLVSSDAARHFSKRDGDPGYDYSGCDKARCTECRGHRRPMYAFVDVTNRCNLNCPMCADSVPGHGFTYEPPIDYLDKIFRHLAQFDPLPTIALFGGEPTVRPDLLDVIKLARSYGFNVRVLTNGIKLADEEYCAAIVKSRAHLLVSYDGCKPATYHQLRQNAKVLALKQKAIENLGKTKRAHVSYVTCLAWGLNDKEVPEILNFCHRQRHILHGIYLMPLVAAWDKSRFDYEPERMTTEDVEQFVNEAFPDHVIRFISLGLASHFTTVGKHLGGEAMPYVGGHPNCESFYALISDGEKYVPIEHYLRVSFPDLAAAFVILEERLAAREQRWKTSLLGRTLGALRLRNFVLRQVGRAQIVSLGLRNARLGRLLKGKGIGKLGHALAMVGGLLIRRDSRKLRERHMNAVDVLRIVTLPLEDDPILETERLERCPSVHVYLDPEDGVFKYIPVCAWRLHNKKILHDLAEHFAPPVEIEVALTSSEKELDHGLHG